VERAQGDVIISSSVQGSASIGAPSGSPFRRAWIVAAIVFQFFLLGLVLAAPDLKAHPSSFLGWVAFWSSTLSLGACIILIGANLAFEPVKNRRLPWLLLLLVLSFVLLGEVIENVSWLRGRNKVLDANDALFVAAKLITLSAQVYALKKMVATKGLSSIILDLLTSLVAVGLVAWLLMLSSEKVAIPLSGAETSAMLLYAFLDLFILFNCFTIVLRIDAFDKIADKITATHVVFGLFLLAASDLYWSALKIQGFEITTQSLSFLIAHASYIMFSLSVLWMTRPKPYDAPLKIEGESLAEELIPFLHVLMSFGLIYLLGYEFFQPFGRTIYPVLLLTVVMLMLRQAMYFRQRGALQTQLAIAATEAQLARLNQYKMDQLKDRAKGNVGVDPVRVEQLRLAIDKGQFLPWYQPIYDSLSGQIKSVEVLCRYHHPEHGILPPKHFIEDIEDAGLSSRLALSILPTALRDFQVLKGAGLLSPETSLSVNATAHDLHESAFFEGVVKLAKQHRVKLSDLTLELTERIMADERLFEHAGLSKLRGLGVKLAIDDFGTGYSALSYVDQLRPEIIKIGQGFIDNIVTRPNLAKVLKSIAEMTSRLHIQLVVEGVETKGQLYLIQEIGCTLVQGYIFAEPMAYADLEKSLKKAL
jgi:EAL domain-containing protein (putative c-di-GMP-specific phosphodiesterase class I)